MLLAVLLLCVAAGSATAAPGDLDTSFGGDGRVVSTFSEQSQGNAVVVQPDAEFATIAEVTSGRDDVVPRVVHGWHPSVVGRHFPIPENSPTDLCLDDDEPVVIGDFGRVRALRTGVMAREAHARSAVCVAIAGGAGVFALTSPRADAFAGQDLSFLSSLATVLASRWRTEPAPLAAVPA